MLRKILISTVLAATVALTASPVALAHGVAAHHAPHVLACGVLSGSDTC